METIYELAKTYQKIVKSKMSRLDMNDVCVEVYYKIKTTDSWDSLIYYVKEHSVQELIKPFETMLKREIFVALRIEFTYL